jgi:hypothetical protein
MSNDRFIYFEDVNWRKEVRSRNLSNSVDLYESYSSQIQWEITNDTLQVRDIGYTEHLFAGVSIPFISNNTIFEFTINAKVFSTITAGHEFWASVFIENGDTSWEIVGEEQIVVFKNEWKNISLRFNNLSIDQKYYLLLYYCDKWMDSVYQTIYFNNLILNYFNSNLTYSWINNEPSTDSERLFLYDDVLWKKEVRTRNQFYSVDIFNNWHTNILWNVNSDFIKVSEETAVFEIHFGVSTSFIANSTSINFQLTGKSSGNHPDVIRFGVGLYKINPDFSWYLESISGFKSRPTDWISETFEFSNLTIGRYYRLFIFTSDGSVANWNQAIYLKNFKFLQNITDVDRYITFENHTWRKELRHYDLSNSYDRYESDYSNINWNVTEGVLSVKDVGYTEAIIVGVSIPIMTNDSKLEFTLSAKIFSSYSEGSEFWTSLFIEDENNNWHIVGDKKIVVFKNEWKTISLRFDNLTIEQNYQLALYYIDYWYDGWDQTIYISNFTLNYFNTDYLYTWINYEPEVNSERIVNFGAYSWRKEIRTKNNYFSEDKFEEIKTKIKWDIQDTSISAIEQNAIWGKNYGYSFAFISNSSTISFSITGKGSGIIPEVRSLKIALYKINPDYSWYSVNYYAVANSSDWITEFVTFSELTKGQYYRLFIFTADYTIAFWQQGVHIKEFQLSENISSIPDENATILEVIIPSTIMVEKTDISIKTNKLGSLSVYLNDSSIFSGSIVNDVVITIDPAIIKSGVYILIVEFISSEGDKVTKSEILTIGLTKSESVENSITSINFYSSKFEFIFIFILILIPLKKLKRKMIHNL